MTDIPLEKQPFFKEALEGKLQQLVLPYERDIPQANDNTLRFLHKKLLSDDGKALKTLKHLAVQGCELGDEGVALLADIISHAPNLQKINFVYNQFTPEQTTVITDSLKGHRSLTALVFAHENMGSVPADTIADVIQNTPALENLFIRNSRFGDEACERLAELLPKTKITSFGIQNSDTTETGVEAIVGGAEKSPQLVSLCIAESLADCPKKAPVLRRAASIPHLRRLELVDNGLNANEAHQVADFMGRNPSLDTVFLHEKGLPANKLARAAKIALQGSQSIVLASFNGNPKGAFASPALDDLKTITQGIPDFSCLYLNDTRIEGNNSFERKDISQTLGRLPHGRTALKRLEPKNLRYLAQHPKSVFHMSQWECTGILKAEAAYADFVKELPGIPAQDDGWTKPNATGFAPVDNPHLWDTAEKTKKILSEAPITFDMLMEKSPKGMTMADAALNSLRGEDFVRAINAQGVKFGAKELLNEDGGLSPLSKKLAFKTQWMRALFVEENWLGKKPSEMRQVFAAMPDYVKEHLSVHTLEQQMRRHSPTQSTIGR